MIVNGVEIMEGGTIPRGYGVAYWKQDHDAAVCYPFPINRIVGFVRNAYLRIRHVKMIRAEQEALQRIRDARREIKEEGSKIGYKQGYRAGCLEGRLQGNSGRTTDSI